MTRRSISTALASLLVSLLVVVNAPPVSADAPIHIRSGNGMGQEQFEMMQARGDGLFIFAAPTAEVVDIDSASVQQRVREESTTAADTVAYYRTIDGATYYDRFTTQQETAKR